MSSKELISCKIDGCSMTFKNRMAQWRHINNNKCNGVPSQNIDSIVEEDDYYRCTTCNVISFTAE